jgi:hypothetical protein
MKILNQSRALRASTLPLFAAVLMATSSANAATPIGHHKPVRHHHITQSSAQEPQPNAEPVMPPAQEKFDYHPSCFQTRNQVMDGNGGLKWVPRMECRY